MTHPSRLSALALATAISSFFLSDASAEDLLQGWTEDERNAMYYGSQGSRLIPLSWFEALELEDGTAFSSLDHLTKFGLLPPPAGAPSNLPIGIAKDRQDDRSFTYSKLRWFEGQGGRKNTAEIWVGLNCAACHTGSYMHEGELHVVSGAPSMFDYQSFIRTLDTTLQETRTDPDRWDRFSAKVLQGRDTDKNRELLEASYTQLLAWQERTAGFNETGMDYGYARVDAIGHIFNRVLMFSNPSQNGEIGNEPNAPVSYPFLWNIWKQDSVQWNGVVPNARIKIGRGEFETGALGRNTGEVIGVFADVDIKDGPLGLSGYTSSVNVNNLNRMENLLKKLEPPAWPAGFPAIDMAAAETGKALFAEKCAACHLTPDMQEEGKPTERMTLFNGSMLDQMNAQTKQDKGVEPYFFRFREEDVTDIWMACNAFLFSGPTGNMEGRTFEGDEKLGHEAPVLNMLTVAVKGALLGKKLQLLGEAKNTFFGIQKLPTVVDREFVVPDRRTSDMLQCLNTPLPILGYKARPLDGIWATAPYLHNGSVPTLYDLLTPAEKRPKVFCVGSREYDTEKAGYVSDVTLDDAGAPSCEGDASLFMTHDETGKIYEGNGNQGHDYGASTFTDEERHALVEYMKSL